MKRSNLDKMGGKDGKKVVKGTLAENPVAVNPRRLWEKSGVRRGRGATK